MTEQELREKIARIIAKHLCKNRYSHFQLYGDSANCYSRENFAECEAVADTVDALIAEGIRFGNKHRIFIENVPIPTTFVDDTFYIVPDTPPTIKQLYGDEEVEQIVKERDEYKHRAEVAEKIVGKALSLLSGTSFEEIFECSSCPVKDKCNAKCTNECANLWKNYFTNQAEKELAEENDGKKEV